MDYRELPKEFLDKMKLLLGEEYQKYIASYKEEAHSGLRVNTAKLSPEMFLDMAGKADWNLRPVPWTKNGFYYQNERPSKHPWYYAGLYYLQEPSAMSPAAYLTIEPGDKVLDLCAAPGGKSTELAAKLRGTGVLFSNDISNSRAKALLKNLEMFGAGNICVTSETPEKLSRVLPEYFDKILVDAPCSGEGMFRRDPSMIKSWREKGPAFYALLQREILDFAVQMLAPGGKIVYSTCTFDRDEDEGIIEWIVERYPEMSVIPLHPEYGFENSRGVEGCLRLFPHRLDGEGHFVALLEKEKFKNVVPGERDDNSIRKLFSDTDKFRVDSCISNGKERLSPVIADKPSGKEKIIGRAKNEKKSAIKGKCRSNEKGRESLKNAEEDFSTLFDFLSQFPENRWNYKQIYHDGERIYYLPHELSGECMKNFRHLRCLRTGLFLGELKKGRFEPSQALAMNLKMGEFINCLNLVVSDERVIRYLKGETLTVDKEEAEEISDGLMLVCVDGFSLGWAQKRGTQIKNKYNPGWRWM